MNEDAGLEKARQAEAATQAFMAPIAAREEALKRSMSRQAAEVSEAVEASTRPIREAAEAAARSKREADTRQERIATALESGNLASTKQFRWTRAVAVLAALVALAGLIVAVLALR